MKQLFGTDGIRAEAGKFPLDPRTVAIVGFSLATHLREKVGTSPVIVVGRDTRESGAWIERALINGANAAGASCQSAGVITTPGVALLTKRLNAHAGVVISASHNPYYDNGIKIFSPTGRKIDDSIERIIEADIFSQANNDAQFDQQSAGPGSSPTVKEGWFSDAPALSHGRATAPNRAIPRESDPDVISESSLQGLYLKFLADEIGHDLSVRNVRLVIDCANGASSNLAPDLFRRLGADVVAINNEPDGRNINLNCGSLHIDGLRNRVNAEKADLGVAFDGDADRALFVDEHGTFVDGDATLWVLANYLLSKNKLKRNTVVATVMSNVGLEIALKSKDLQLIRTDVGDKYVLDELLRGSFSLGGEQSGHVIMPELSLAGDGMVTALCTLRAMIHEDKSLGQLTNGFNRYPQVLLNVRVSKKQPFEELPNVQEVVKATEKTLEGRGRLLLRYSGTESLARVMIEGEDQVEIENLAGAIASEIQGAIGA